MFRFLKQPNRLIDVINLLEPSNRRFINTLRPLSFSANYFSENTLFSTGQNKGFLIANEPFRLVLTRNKYEGKRKKRMTQEDDESDDEGDADDDDNNETDARVYNLSAARCDLILKSILGISRKTVEEAFYKNKIRVNGERLMKKSHIVEAGDRVDIINSLSPDSNYLNIGRVEIVNIKTDKESGKILIKAFKQKSLKIKNYSDVNAYREPTEDE